jgi:hypothetical protein
VSQLARDVGISRALRHSTFAAWTIRVTTATLSLAMAWTTKAG